MVGGHRLGLRSANASRPRSRSASHSEKAVAAGQLRLTPRKGHGEPRQHGNSHRWRYVAADLMPARDRPGRRGGPARPVGARTGRSSIETTASVKEIAALKTKIHELISQKWLWTTAEDRVAKPNRKFRGWPNYFCLGRVFPAFRAIDRHARHRLRQWLRGMHELRSRGTSRSPDARLHDEFGLIRLCDRPRSLPWAKASALVRQPGAGNRPSGSMSGE